MIHFDIPMDNRKLYPISREPREKVSPPPNTAREPVSFLDRLKKASDRTKPGTAGLEQNPSGLNTQKALALHQRMELQMNETLLRILSNTESNTEENNLFKNTMMEDLRDFLPQGPDQAPILSMIQQAPSENDLSRTQSPDQRPPDQTIEKPEKPQGKNPDIHGIDKIIQKASLTYGVDSELIKKVIQAESSFNPNAVSPKGAKGLMQLMPGTARELGVSDPLNPVENIMAGTRYLKKLLDRYDGSVPLALAAYNWGMGNLDSHRSRMPAETRNYVAKITGITLA